MKQKTFEKILEIWKESEKKEKDSILYRIDKRSHRVHSLRTLQCLRIGDFGNYIINKLDLTKDQQKHVENCKYCKLNIKLFFNNLISAKIKYQDLDGKIQLKLPIQQMAEELSRSFFNWQDKYGNDIYPEDLYEKSKQAMEYSILNLPLIPFAKAAHNIKFLRFNGESKTENGIKDVLKSKYANYKFTPLPFQDVFILLIVKPEIKQHYSIETIMISPDGENFLSEVKQHIFVNYKIEKKVISDKYGGWSNLGRFSQSNLIIRILSPQFNTKFLSIIIDI